MKTTAIPSKSEATPEAKPRPRMSTTLQRLQRTVGNLRMQQLVQAHRHDPFEAQADRVARQVKGHGVTSDAVRRSVEAATGTDLSEARVHDDPAAHRIAEGLHANAVTRGNDIYLHQRASQSVDTQNANKDRISNAGPNYIEQWGLAPPLNQFGFLRSPSDLQAASLYDYPSSPFDTDFQFETVAKATDTQSIYGALHWGFGIRSGALVAEYARTMPMESTTFNEALERFRGYYTHEPVVLYFDTNIDTPMTGEAAKLTGVVEYLRRYPDAIAHLDGYADERGSIALNDELSLRRAESVQRMLTLLGVDPLRVALTMGWGRTTAFAAGRTSGRLQANRRVVITFVRTASTPIVMP
jgi:outer membrane protein OmpA-like peptidoglycan-associated protein